MRSSSSSVTVSSNSRRGSPYESYSEDIKGGVLLVSVDFDSCLAGTAFVERYKEIAHLRESDFDKYIDEYKKILNDVHPKLIDYILERAAGAEEVIVMIGSNRQLPDIDRSNARNNGNGSCFDGVPILTELLQEKMPHKRVCHQPYTLGDSIYNQPAGYTGTVTLAQSKPEARWDKSNELSTVFADVIKDKKYFLMYQQAMMICAARPNAKVDMVFFDDLPEVLTVAAHEFSAKGVKNAMPSNFGSITLTSYEDNKLLSVPNNILEYINHGESAEIPAYLVKDCLQLIDILHQAATQWVELASGYSEQIAALQERTALLNQRISNEQAKTNAKINALVNTYLFANEKFAAVFEKTIQVVNKSLVVGDKGVELVAQFQAAFDAGNQAELLALIMNPSFQGIIQGEDASAQVAAFSGRSGPYRELANQIRTENKGIIAGYKTELEKIDCEYQINNDLLRSFSLCKKEHLLALDAARAYFGSGADFTKEDVMQHVSAIKKATDFLDAKAIANMAVLRDEAGANDNNANIDVRTVCGRMLEFVSQTQAALVRHADNRLHLVKKVDVNGSFPAHHCSAVFGDTRAHNEFVASCMNEKLWNTDVPAPELAKMESIFYQSLAISNLRQLLSQSPFADKIAAKKKSKGVKRICHLLEINPDKLDSLALLEACKQIALEKVEPKKTTKNKLKQEQVLGVAKELCDNILGSGVSRDRDNIALYKMLAITNMESPVMLLSMKTVHAYLMKNGSKFTFVQPYERPLQAARASQVGAFHRAPTGSAKANVFVPPKMKRGGREDK